MSIIVNDSLMIILIIFFLFYRFNWQCTCYITICSTVNWYAFQWLLSSLDLKAFTDGADTTFSGNEFQGFTTRWLKQCSLSVLLHLGLISFLVWPLVTVLVSGFSHSLSISYTLCWYLRPVRRGGGSLGANEPPSEKSTTKWLGSFCKLFLH